MKTEIRPSNMLKWLVSTTSARVHSPLLSDPHRTTVQTKIHQKMWNISMVFSASLFNFGVFDDDAHSVCTLQFILFCFFWRSLRGCFCGTSDSPPAGLDFVSIFSSFHFENIMFKSCCHGVIESAQSIQCQQPNIHLRRKKWGFRFFNNLVGR